MYKKQLITLIIATTVLRLILAAVVGFGNDEVYYYTYTLHLQSNYFDHPPGVAVLIRLFTFNLYFQQQVFIRLGSIVFAAIATWLAYNIGALIRNPRTGWYAAILYNTSVYSSIIAGTFILPDSPQSVFWLASLYIMLKMVMASNNGGKATTMQWLLFGVLAGLCIMCKIHGGFLWIGLGLYMLFYNRRMFLHPGFWLAAIITAAIISPIFIWNMQNNFITWRYHSQRVEVHKFTLNTDGFIQVFFGQLLYNNPLNVFICLAAIFGLRKTTVLPIYIKRLLLLCGLPVILFVTLFSLLRDMLPHWSGPGFVTLQFIAAAFIDDKFANNAKTVWRKLLTGSAVLILTLVAGGALLVNFYPGTIGSHDEKKYGDGDFSLDMYGWQKFGVDFNAWQHDAIAQNQISQGLPIVCLQWFPAAHIEYYVTRPQGSWVTGVGEINDLHQYVWLNHYRGGLAPGADALCIIPSNYYRDVQTTYGSYFQSATLLHTFTETRSGQTTRYFNVYLLKSYKANDEAQDYKLK